MFRLKDRKKCAELFRKYYAAEKFHDDLYRDAIRRYLRPGDRLLDAGCGRYLKFCKEFSGMAEVVGLDLEPNLETRNDGFPFGVRGDLACLPFSSDQFDVVISRSVIEHLDDPPRVFREFWRVLRPGGRVVIITPNKYDYVSLIAAITPYSLHRKLVSRIFQSPEDDVFPTRYRANTIGAMRRSLTATGFVERELGTINHYPAYLMFSPVLFRLGVWYGRVTAHRLFQSLRASILCVFEKDPAAKDGDRAAHPLKRSAREGIEVA